jgi:GH25 family lysozyme M1 (1,4-beta-N-acetylmuramidase)
MFPDISEHQGAVDWNALGAAFQAGQIEAVSMRAGFGTVRADFQFARNQSECRARGIPAIFYWFNYPTFNSPQAEAAMFNRTVGPLRDGEAMMGDFEDDESDPNNPILFPRGQAGVDWASAFLSALESPTNATWFYTYTSLFNAVGMGPLLATWPFVWADYRAEVPDSTFPAIARQFTDCGQTPGVVGCCDQNRVLKPPLSQWLQGGGMTQDQINALARVLIAVFKGRTPFDQAELDSIIGQLTPGNFEAAVTALELAPEYSGSDGVAALTLKNRIAKIPAGPPGPPGPATYVPHKHSTDTGTP